jgi:hypothetical protein
MALSRNPKRRVPKEFLGPRPMSGPVRQRSRFSRVVQLRAATVLWGVLLTYAVSWTQLDSWWFAGLLQLTRDAQPSQRVALLSVGANSVQSGRCSQTVLNALTHGEAQAGLLLPPLDSLCPPEQAPNAEVEHGPPIEALPAQLFPEQTNWSQNPSALSPLLRTLGVPEATWLRQRALHAVPVTSAERLVTGDVDQSLIKDRVAVVTLALTDGDVSPEAKRQAGRLSAALELVPVRAFAAWELLLMSALGASLLVWARKALVSHPRWQFIALFGFGLSLAIATTSLLRWGLLFPLPSLLAGYAACWLLLDLPLQLRKRRADRSAEQLIRKASRLLEMRAPEYLDDGEFWQGLARKASHAHPADNVLVAELPPFNWRLHVWPNGDLDDSVIRERRRDIRRTPYSNLQGVPVASVVHDYLVMKSVPTVMVPILHGGEVEGYVLLLGQAAADFFTETPQVAQELARELASLIKTRRLLQQQENPFRSQHGGGAQRGTAEEMLAGARAALTELRLMTTLVQGAPAGLCYADPFGDVRILGKPWLKWLPQLGSELPTLATQSTLKPGQLTLRDLLLTLTRQVGKPAPLLSDLGAAGYTLDVPAARGQESANSLRLHVVRLEESAESSVGGFLASLTEVPVRTETSASRPSMVAVGGDQLVVFSLSRLVQRLVTTLSASASVKLQTPREPAHVIGHRVELREALEAFFINASSQSSKGGGPVVSIKEHADRVELRVLDLKLGVPSAALQRTVQAPSVPPPGLNPLGALVRAVENSHGRVELKTDGSWGAELELTFVRARPRIESAEAILQNLKVSQQPLRI